MEDVKGVLCPTRVGQFYQTTRSQPWRPTLGYENVELIPLASHPLTNAYLDKSYTSAKMSTEPIRFPNLVTSVERNPPHAARTALYSRYTPFEWTQSNINYYNESETNRNYAERLRNEAVRVIRDTEERTAAAQRDSGRRLGERITDTTFWRNALSTELERLLAESNLLQDKRKDLEKSIQDIEGPHHIAQECLYQRENRIGIDLVHDQVEKSLLKEVEIQRNCRDRLKSIHDKVCQQLRNNRAAQHELETDLNLKESTLDIDTLCHQLNNFSRGINYFGGIEKFDPTVTVPETWAENSNRIIQRSQNERFKSSQSRSDSDNLINACANEIWNSWNATNNSLANRSSEILEAKNKLQMHLHKVQQEIFDVEKHMDMLRKAIMDKSNPMKVAHTRLEARTHRRDGELCRDPAQQRLVQEVGELGESLDQLHRKLQEAEAQHQQLLRTRAGLESDLQIKVNSLFIDQDKCLGMRRSFPITATIKY
ncbi:tektin-3-like [Schistocerca cancellata]|uniref:tektin-3-like n=1 Tax=Schistocerca cancellata TaxID=274614 RepID=UPI0021187BB3|nr:tektin-3-like [Schistocerca cancellata]